MNRPAFIEGSILWRDGLTNTVERYSPEVRERAVRMVLELQRERS